MHKQHGSRKERTGTDRLVSTSVHMPHEYLDRIDELGEKPSPFCRVAVGEKLEREEGYLAAIQRMENDIDRFERELEQGRTTLASLNKKHKAWQQEKDKSEIRDIILAELLTEFYQTEADLLTEIKELLEKRPVTGLKQLVHEVWIDIKGEG